MEMLLIPPKVILKCFITLFWKIFGLKHMQKKKIKTASTLKEHNNINSEAGDTGNHIW